MNLIDKAILEWSYRTKKGYPDINNQNDLDIFKNIFGFLITLSAGLSWAIGTMIVKYGGIKSDGLIVAGWQQIIGIVPIIPFALYFDLDIFAGVFSVILLRNS